MSIQQILDAQQRLVILRSLLDIGGAANESILNDCLDQLGTGRVTRDRVKTLLAWLEEQGLVERHCCSQDKRARIVTLTPAGKALLDQIEDRIMEIRRELLAGISQRELEQFEDIVHRICANALGKIGAQSEERE